MSGVATTTTALLRSKKPLAQFPEFVGLRDDVVALREEVAEVRDSGSKRASRAARREADADDLARRHDAELGELRAQMTALSKAFRALSDVVVDEVEGIKAELASQRSDVAVLQRQLRWTHSCASDMASLRAFVEKKVVEEGADTARRVGACEATVEAFGERVDACESVGAATRDALRAHGETRAEDLHLNHEVLDASRRHQAKLEHRCALLERRAGRTEEALARITRTVAVNAAETNEALRASAEATASAAAVAGTSVARRSTDAFDREAMTPRARNNGGSTLGLSPASRRFLERD